MDSNGRSRGETLALLAALAWGGALVAAYLAERAELLELPSLLVGLARAPGADGSGVGGALARAAAATAAALAVALACYGLGRAIARWVRPPRRFGGLFAECCAFALGTGAGAMAVFAAGHAGALTPVVASALAAAGIAALVVTLVLDRERLAGGARRALAELARDRAALAALAAAACFAVPSAFVALAPPTARDAVIYHLAAPRAYVAAGRLVEIPENVHSYLPFNTEMLFTWALLLGPDVAANLVHLAFWVATLAALYALGRSLGGRPRWGALAALLFASVPSAAWNAGIAHNEMSMSLYVAIALALLGAWAAGGGGRDLAWFAVALGLALGTKHTALWLAPVAAVAVLYRVLRAPAEERGRLVVASAGAAALAIGLALPWYAQNAARTGNPVYPYFWDLFPTRHPLWDARRAAVFELYLRETYGAAGGALERLRLPWDVSIRAVDNDARYFDGVVGPAFLLLAPFAAATLWRRRDEAGRVAAALGALALLGMLVWAGQSQQIRFLLPYLAAASAVAAAALARTEGPPAARGALLGVVGVVVAVNFCAVVASVAAANPVHVALGLESRRAYLGRVTPYYRFYELLEREMGPGDRVFLVDMRNDTYNLERAAFSDSVLEHYTLAEIVAAARGPDEIGAALEARGITHLLVGDDILMNPAYTPFDAAEADRWTAFLRANARRLASDGRITLYELKERR